MNNNTRTGTLTIVDDANVINVEVGFTPSYIRIVNATDPKTFEWFDNFADGSAFQEVNHDNTQRSVVTTNYITPYAGRAAGDPISGTAAASAASGSVTGTSTNFVGELAVGDVVIINGETKTVTAITSAVAMTVSPVFVADASGDLIYEQGGKAEGFTLGTGITDDDNDVLHWLAIR